MRRADAVSPLQTASPQTCPSSSVLQTFPCIACPVPHADFCALSRPAQTPGALDFSVDHRSLRLTGPPARPCPTRRARCGLVPHGGVSAGVRHLLPVASCLAGRLSCFPASITRPGVPPARGPQAVAAAPAFCPLFPHMSVSAAGSVARPLAFSRLHLWKQKVFGAVGFVSSPQRMPHDFCFCCCAPKPEGSVCNEAQLISDAPSVCLCFVFSFGCETDGLLGLYRVLNMKTFCMLLFWNISLTYLPVPKKFILIVNIQSRRLHSCLRYV